MKVKYIFAICLVIIATTLAIKWYDWKLILIIFLLLWANNIERSISIRLTFKKVVKQIIDTNNTDKVD